MLKEIKIDLEQPILNENNEPYWFSNTCKNNKGENITQTEKMVMKYIIRSSLNRLNYKDNKVLIKTIFYKMKEILTSKKKNKILVVSEAEKDFIIKAIDENIDLANLIKIDAVSIIET